MASVHTAAPTPFTPVPKSPDVKWIWGATIFLSAFLLFQVQPILAKLILPWFGGAASVWLISLAFFQLTYLLGNLYAHLLLTGFNSHFSARVHALALLVSLLFLPVVPSASWQPQPGQEPAWRILGLLSVTVGLPFLLLSATSSLLQAWYSRSNSGAMPYRFYALSNAASLLALLTYPVLIEPHIATTRQARFWSAGYAAFVAICAWVALRQKNQKDSHAHSHVDARPTPTTQLLWLFLAATASALLLSITHHASRNIAAIPLLWIVPLSIYLLSLILCFEGQRWYQRRLFLRLLPIALGGMAYALSPDFENAPPQLTIPLFFGGLFVCCMVCHGEMVRSKPRPEFLSLFYLMLSAGGALGGLLVALVAPRVFRGFCELPIALGSCALLVVLSIYRDKQDSSDRLAQPLFFAGAAMAGLLIIFCGRVIWQQSSQAMVMVRNFYGVLRVNDLPPGGVRPAMRQLRNGTIIHGAQILDSARHGAPTTYFGPHSGAGMALQLARLRGPIRVGIVGLGAGTLATYGRAGDHYTFYEINPLDIDIARTQFNFLRRSPAQIEIIPGDARLSMSSEPPQKFNVLLVDAFSGDAIPIHLLTREAFALYFRHLAPDGLLAIHVSNRFLDLPPVVQAAGHAIGAHVAKIESAGDQANAIFQATWMILEKPDQPAAAPFSGLLPPGTRSVDQERNVPAWTDDFSDLFQILK